MPMPRTESSAPVMDAVTHAELENAARVAMRAFPGPVGDFVARELYAWSDFGFRFGGQSETRRLVKHLLDEVGPKLKEQSVRV